jgi:hypothetical protein
MIARLLRHVPGGPIPRIYRFIANPVGTQERLLRRLLTRAADTEWGRRFSFADLCREANATAAFRTAVPLHSYADLREDISRMRATNRDVMWPGRVTDFAVSSGTSSAGNVLPVSKATLNANKRFSMGLMYNYIAQTGKMAFLAGKFLSVPGRVEQDPEFPGTWIGEVSGLQARYAPSFVRRFYQAVPNETLFLPNWEKKLDVIVRQTLGMDIRSTAMVPTWALVLFEQLLDQYNAVTGGSATNIRDIWPNFSVFFSGGVALSSYRTILEEQLGLEMDVGACDAGRSSVDFMEAYGASEGFFAFQFAPADRDMVLHLDNGVYYEFVKLDDVRSAEVTSDGQAADLRRYSIGEVEVGVRYQMYVSTCSGLWAYGVGDVVRFTSVNPHKIVVAGRVDEMIDRFGEAVFGEEARAALAEACARCDATVVDYHVAPSDPGRRTLPTHLWYVEFDRRPVDTSDFARAIDAYLQRVNRHYQIRREGRAFGSPRVVSLPKGTFYKWLRQTRNAVSAQSKIPRMSEDRRIANDLEAMVGL